MSTSLYWAERRSDMAIEWQMRAYRLWQFLETANHPVLYKDIRREMGWSYDQTVKAVGILKQIGIVAVSVTAEWNGMNYVYPHRVSLSEPPLL